LFFSSSEPDAHSLGGSGSGSETSYLTGIPHKILCFPTGEEIFADPAPFQP
jgi:hypothetical protein